MSLRLERHSFSASAHLDTLQVPYQVPFDPNLRSVVARNYPGSSKQARSWFI